MATGDLITTEWQIERGGLLMGDGTDYDLVRVTGLAGHPATRPSDRAMAQRHGAVAGEDYLTPRVMTFTFEIVETASATMTTKLDALSRAMAPSVLELPTAFRVPGVGLGGVVTANTHIRRRTVPIGLAYANGVARATFQMVASDPRLYALAQQSVLVGAAETASVGLTFDASFDLSFGGAIAPGLVEITNTGTIDAPFIYRIYGPVTDPVVTRSSDGAYMAFTKTLAGATDFIEVDTAARTVLIGGVTNDYASLDADSTWYDLEPGLNEIRLTRTGSDAATLVVYLYDAFA